MMPITISVSDFRTGIADYLRLAAAGRTVVISDERRGVRIAKLVADKQFDSSAYRAMLNRVAGAFAAARHPEWSTPAKLESWLRAGRLADERNFYDRS